MQIYTLEFIGWSMTPYFTADKNPLLLGVFSSREAAMEAGRNEYEPDNEQFSWLASGYINGQRFWTASVTHTIHGGGMVELRVIEFTMDEFVKLRLPNIFEAQV
jgi:hypothetical protein